MLDINDLLAYLCQLVPANARFKLKNGKWLKPEFGKGWLSTPSNSHLSEENLGRHHEI